MDISVHITVALICMETKIRKFKSRPCEDARDREHCRPLGRHLGWPLLMDLKDIVKRAVLSGGLPFLFLFDFSLLRWRLT